jgi:hypothetical protein
MSVEAPQMRHRHATSFKHKTETEMTKQKFAFILVLILFVTGIVTSIGPNAFARPEYAAQYRTTNCLACHYNAWGGGPRNIDGKYFGSRYSSWPSPLSQQSWVGADVRSVSYYPKGGTKSRQGTALMTSTASVAAPIKKDEDGSQLTAIAAYSLGVVNVGAREIFVSWHSAPVAERPTAVQFGRFNAPFGLSTDEHRTYTKLLTRTEIFDYEYGGSISGDPLESLHYDFALTNGLQSGGNFNANSPAAEDATSAAFANLRWSPVAAPLFLGLSAGYHDRLSPNKDPYAVAGYVVLSLDRATGNRVMGSVLGEAVYAEHWADADINPNIGRYFIPPGDATYTSAIKNVPALAYVTQLNLNVKKNLVAQYKLDSITFDPKYSGDRYLRHGFGVKYFFDSNIIITTRYEIADVGRPEFKDKLAYAAQDAFWAMFQLWL